MRLRYYYVLILVLFGILIMYNTTKMLDLLRTHSEASQQLSQRPGPPRRDTKVHDTKAHDTKVHETHYELKRFTGNHNNQNFQRSSDDDHNKPHHLSYADAKKRALRISQDYLKHHHGTTTTPDPLPEPTRVVFSLTTTKSRVDKVKPTLDSIMKQTRPADAVYLSVGPDVSQVPQWLQDMSRSNSSTLKLLHMKEDYGPASKLLAALHEGSEHDSSTVVIYGDDDMLYGPRIIELHMDAQSEIHKPTAYGTRRIAIGEEGSAKWEQMLEATGSVSIRASYLRDNLVFRVSRLPDACRLSDDYWISHFLVKAKVTLELLPTCQYDFGLSIWPESCSQPFETIPEVQHIGALSETQLDANGHGKRAGGDWQDQLGRYSKCQSMMIELLENPPLV